MQLDKKYRVFVNQNSQGETPLIIPFIWLHRQGSFQPDTSQPDCIEAKTKPGDLLFNKSLLQVPFTTMLNTSVSNLKNQNSRSNNNCSDWLKEYPISPMKD